MAVLVSLTTDMFTSIYKSATACDEEIVFESTTQTNLFVKMIFCDLCETIHEFILETSVATKISIFHENEEF